MQTRHHGKLYFQMASSHLKQSLSSVAPKLSAPPLLENSHMVQGVSSVNVGSVSFCKPQICWNLAFLCFVLTLFNILFRSGAKMAASFVLFFCNQIDNWRVLDLRSPQIYPVITPTNVKTQSWNGPLASCRLSRLLLQHNRPKCTTPRQFRVFPKLDSDLNEEVRTEEIIPIRQTKTRAGLKQSRVQKTWS